MNPPRQLAWRAASGRHTSATWMNERKYSGCATCESSGASQPPFAELRSHFLTLVESRSQRGIVRTMNRRDMQTLPASKPGFTFIDLFSGIGGLRIGLEAVGGKCLFSCEINPYARKTYHAWFGETPENDVTDFTSGEGVPHHDVLTGGFPCQPFSIAGVSKKNSLGRAHGFEDKASGTLFFHLARLIESKQPSVLLLENVKNLRAHNKGDTWHTIVERLDELGYCVFFQVVDAAAYVPQHRERIFIVGFRRESFGDSPPFRFPEPPIETAPILQDILERENDVPDKYVLSEILWNYLQEYARKHQAKGNGCRAEDGSLCNPGPAVLQWRICAT